MTDSGKRGPSSPKKSLLGTVREQGENDDISDRTGGVETPSGADSESSSSLDSSEKTNAFSGKQIMESSSSPDASEKTNAAKRSFHAQLSRSFLYSRSSSFSSSVDGCAGPSRHRFGTVAVEDPITRQKVVNSRVLLLYTGGALGWKVDPLGIHLDKNNVLKDMKKLPMMHDIEYVDYIQDNVLDDIPEEGIGPDTLVIVSAYNRVRIV